jgi:hypothetical protein
MPVPEAVDAINTISQTAECDPVELVATVLAAMLINDPSRIRAAVQVLDAYGFDFHDRYSLFDAAKADRLAVDAARRYRQQLHARES